MKLTTASSRTDAALMAKQHPSDRAPRQLHWYYWPLVRPRWSEASLVAGAVLLLGLALYVVQHWLWAVAALAAGLLAFRRFFFPTVYEIRPEGIEQRFLGRRSYIRWRRITQIEAFRDGLLVHLESNFDVPWQPQQVYIPLPFRDERPNKRQILKAIEYHLEQQRNGRTR